MPTSVATWRSGLRGLTRSSLPSSASSAADIGGALGGAAFASRSTISLTRRLVGSRARRDVCQKIEPRRLEAHEDLRDRRTGTQKKVSALRSSWSSSLRGYFD